MAIQEKDIVLRSLDKNGNIIIGKPITRLANIESDAETKENPADSDYIPIIDTNDNEQMKKTPVSVVRDINNQTPTYTKANSLAEMTSGEKISVAFGKIAKAISDLISHIADSVKHITAEERTAWNGKAAGNHTHSAADVGALTNIKIGTVTTGTAGSKASASASTSGTVTTLNLTIPKGDKGDTGLVYGTCSTAAATAAKTVEITGFNLKVGSTVIVTFTITNTAKNCTLNVTNTGAKEIKYKNTAVSGYLTANKTYLFAYDGTYWQLVGDADTNTVYTHPTTSGNKHIPSGGATGQILRWSADGTAEWGNDNNTTYTPASAAPKAPGTAAV